MNTMIRGRLAGGITLAAALTACSGSAGFFDARVESGADAARDRVVPPEASTGEDAAVMPDAAVMMDAAVAMDAAVPMDAAVGMDVVREASVEGGAADARVDAPVEVVSDVSVVDARVDASVDAAVVDARADASVADVVGDAAVPSRCTPVIDGTVGADWPASALVVRNATASAWGPSNQLRAMRVCYDATNLYLAIEGTSEATNAMVVYFDRDYGSVTTTGVRDFALLTDNAGALDNRVSGALTIGAAGFGAEAAWGTNGPMALAAGATSDNAGLRLFWPTAPIDRRGDFAWQSGASQQCAGATPDAAACEVSIAWTSLFDGPRPATTRVAMFARIMNNDGTMSSNQTLPEDAPATPRTVSRVLVLDVN